MLGKVYLVGSGPGSLDYLTVRGQQLLCQAKVLVYDALADDRLLNLVPADCECLNVGKRGGRPSTPQSEIDRLLVERASEGKLVVRLKSGDPFIFGRSTSELQALVEAGCPFEVVPGISSVLAAPLLAGIPLTDKVLSRCFAVLSGHDPDALDWQALAQIDTLVVLMGGRRLGEIIARLIRYGRSRQTPIAIIRWAGRPEQQVWMGTLADIGDRVRGESLSPTVMVIGEVANLREFLHSPRNNTTMTPDLQSHRPLEGKTILVTRSAGQSSDFSDRLLQQGAKAIEMPALEIVPPSSWAELDRAIAELDRFDWLILSSANGVNYFCDRLLELGKDLRDLASVKIAVVGKKTAKVLKKRHLNADFIPPDFVADSLIEHFPEDLNGKTVLFPRVESGGRQALMREFTQRGADVIQVPAYESRCPDAIAPDALAALQRRQVDAVAFASSKTVKNFCQLIDKTHGISLDGVCIASIGPQTSQSCQSEIGRVDIEASEYTLDGLTQALLDWASNGRNYH